MSQEPGKFERIRNDFPVLRKEKKEKPLIYFDTAATAQKPQQVIDAMTRFMETQYGTVHRAIYELCMQSTELFHQSRCTAQKFLNAKKPEEIIFTRGTTESINSIAYSFGKAFCRPGDEILLAETEHHANIVPWQILREDHGIEIKVIPVNDRSEIDLDAYRDLLSPKTKLVGVAHIANSTGTVHPVKEMARLAHEKGARILIDGAQAAQSLPVDVQDLDCDVYIFSGHKAYGPTGIGVLYGKEDLLNALPPYQGGGDMIDHVSFEKTTYGPLPLKFEAGTPMIIEAIGLKAALDYLQKIELSSIWEHQKQLTQLAENELKKIDGVRLIGTAREKGGIVSFVVNKTHHLDIGTFLNLKGIAVRTGHHCAYPTMDRFGVPGTVRASFGIYNTEEEVKLFAQALRDIVNTLQG